MALGIGGLFGWGRNGKQRRVEEASAYEDEGWRRAGLYGSGSGWSDPEREELDGERLLRECYLAIGATRWRMRLWRCR